MAAYALYEEQYGVEHQKARLDLKNKNKFFDIRRDHYALTCFEGDSAEIVMYGDIVEEIPRDWWSGEEIEGQFIVGREFLEDLDTLKNCRDITIRINSCGGDTGVSLLIHNRLRELAAKGIKLTCIVDGVAMSAATHLMCACDIVRVNPSSLIMIHKCWQCLFGGYNADELRSLAKENDAYDKSQIAMYERKTGLSETVLSHMMADTTFMTGREAVEKGFADEVIEECEPLNISASADGRSIFARGREIHLIPGMFAPDNIPTVSPAASNVQRGAADGTYTKPTGETVENKYTGESDTMTEKELREKYPELVAGIEASARSSGNTEAVNTAIETERTRQQEIDAIAPTIDPDLVRAARYGDTACSAQELAYRAALASAGKGKSFLAALENDAAASGAAGVNPVPGDPDEDDEPKTPEAKMTAARASAKQLLGKPLANDKKGE